MAILMAYGGTAIQEAPVQAFPHSRDPKNGAVILEEMARLIRKACRGALVFSLVDERCGQCFPFTGRAQRKPFRRRATKAEPDQALCEAFALPGPTFPELDVTDNGIRGDGILRTRATFRGRDRRTWMIGHEALF